MITSPHKRCLWLAAGLLSSLLSSLLPSMAVAQPDDESSHSQQALNVVIAGPMSGPSYAIGVQFRVGVRAALAQEANNELLGRQIRVSEYNDGCSREVAKKLAQNLVAAPPALVIGHSCSETTVVAAPIYAAHDVLQISPSSTAPAVTDMGISTLFRMIGRDDTQGKLVAERLKTHHAGQRIGIFRFESDYSHNLTNVVIDELAADGMAPVLVVEGNAGAMSFLDEILQFVDADADVVFIVGTGLDTGIAVRQAKQISAPFSIIGSDTLVSTVFTDTAGQASDGIPFMFPSHAAVLRENDDTRDALTAIRALNAEPHGFTVLSYAAAQVWLQGVQRAGSTNAQAVAAAIRQAPLTTVLGPISFDEKGDIETEYPDYSWFIWQKGERVAIDH